MQDFFLSWKTLEEEHESTAMDQDMDPLEAKQKVLQQVVEQFKDKLETNPWVRTLLENF